MLYTKALCVLYQLLSRMRMDSVFHAYWKDNIKDNVRGYSSLSGKVAKAFLEEDIYRKE